MILLRLVLRNFGPYLGEREIILAPESHQRPICLVGALNGSGKTTLLDAVLLALYGNRARCSTRGKEAYGEFLVECIHSRAPKDEGAAVTVEFEYVLPAGRTRLEVCRSWKNAGKRVTDEVVVRRDNQLDPALTETWSEHVEDLIPLGISNLFFFDGEQVRALAAETETPPEVREAIRTLLGLELPVRLQGDLKIIAARRKKQAAAPEGWREIRDLEEKRRSLISRRREFTQEIGNLRNEISRASGALEKANASFVAKGGDLAQRRDELEREVGAVRARRQHVRASLRTLAGGPLPFLLAPDLVAGALARARCELEHSTNLDSVELLQRRDDDLLGHFRSILSDSDLDGLNEYLGDDRAARATAMEKAPYITATTDEVRLLEMAFEVELPQDRRESEELLEALDVQDLQSAKLQAQVMKAAAPEVVEKALAGLHALNDKHNALVNKENEAHQARNDVRDQLARTDEELERVLTRHAESRLDGEVDRRVLGAVDRVLGVMERYKSVLAARKLGELESLIAERFSHLSRKSGFVRRVEVDAETFSLALFDEDGIPVNRARLSAGEQQLLAVSFLWALAAASGRNLPVVIDTPLSRMDSKHRDKLVERYFPHASHQVVLLSTDVEIDEAYYGKLQALDAVDRVYRIEYDSDLRSSTIQPGYFW